MTKFRRSLRRISPSITPLVITPTRLMEPHGNRERERRQRQIAKGSLKVTAEKRSDERPAEEMPGPGQAEARPTPGTQIEVDGDDAADQ